MSTWFITGCSTGFGRALAETVLERGHSAVITARNPEVLGDLAAAHPHTALAVPLDVRRHDEVVTAVRTAEDRFGAIDVLVNNAGYGLRAAIEEADDADVRDQFDTNVFGLVDVTRQVLPGMRARRRGVVVNLSSIGGRTARAGSGYYSASKFAVEGLSGALRAEVEPLGIRVMVVEPGAFRTDFAGRSLVGSGVPIADYAPTAGPRRKENDRADGTQPGDPYRGAQAILSAAASTVPPFRLLLGSAALARARVELDEQRAELELWAETSLSTDVAHGASAPAR